MRADGAEMQEDDWKDKNIQCFGMLMDGRAQTSGIIKLAKDATLLTIFNAFHDVVQFTLPSSPGGELWSLLIDTSVPDIPTSSFKSGDKYDATGRSLLLFQLQAGESVEEAQLKLLA
jgi:isoamylase